ncbi:MAG: hypothetical protein ACFFEV_01270 [Candidatus Thorarchaeota archaeon]
MNASTNRANWARLIMVITTLVAPFGVYFFSLSNSSISVSIHAILWGLMPEESGPSGSFIFDLYIIIGRGLFYGLFNIWFGFEVIRYFNNYTRRRAVIISGILSIVYPFVLTVVAWPWIIQSESFVYLGPIPIQLIIGFLLMYFLHPEEPTDPW